MKSCRTPYICTPQMAYILHIDTSGETGLVALAHNGQLLSVIENTDTRNHAATLNINIEALLAQHNISLQGLDALCVCGGPGSYTGLRIGLATAKGFCYAMDKPLMMHNKLLLLAVNHMKSNLAENIVSILPARDKEYFAAVYNRELNIIKEPQHLHQADLEAFTAELQANFLCAGYRDEAIKLAFDNKISGYSDTTTPDMAAWAQYSFQQFICNDFVNPANSEPFYLKQVYTHKQKTIS